MSPDFNWEPVVVYHTHEMVILGIAALFFVLSIVLVIVSRIFWKDLTSDGKTINDGHRKELVSYFIAGAAIIAVCVPVIFWETHKFIERDNQNAQTLAETIKTSVDVDLTDTEAKNFFYDRKITKNDTTLVLTEDKTGSFQLEVK
jgi:hypothetical protein